MASKPRSAMVPPAREAEVLGSPETRSRSPRQRLPLSGNSPRRLSFERRLRLWLALLCLPAFLLAAFLLYEHLQAAGLMSLGLFLLVLFQAVVFSVVMEQFIRPLQTLSNVVAALREDDFSFRARGARRGDALGDLALEINALASTLQQQRVSAMDALTLAQLVITAMPSPVLAFDQRGDLLLLNPAAAHAFHLDQRKAPGTSAAALHLEALLSVPDQGTYLAELPVGEEPPSPEATRWSVRRTTFRLQGVAHSLFVLADVAAALREEERVAWQRLIRVLGHEINNSLAPIKSIAGSLRGRLGATALSSGDGSPEVHDLHRGLTIIEERADSLNRFLQAYHRLSRLPEPAFQTVELASLLESVCGLELRLAIHLETSEETFLLADPDQLQQLFINLLRNAVEAALVPDRSHPQGPPRVDVHWNLTRSDVLISIIDNGPGLTNPANLFVPFYTTKPGGSGIGLLLARQIASAHHGALDLRSRRGTSGCIAEVRLPRIHL